MVDRAADHRRASPPRGRPGRCGGPTRRRRCGGTRRGFLSSKRFPNHGFDTGESVLRAS
jgi:hypothetical protein